MGVIGLVLMTPTVQKVESLTTATGLMTVLLWVGAVIGAIVSGRKLRKWNSPAQCGGVRITLNNGGLGGTLQTNDGIAGLVITGVSEGGGYTLGSTILLTGMTSVATAGITVGNNPYAYRHLTEFYNEAGDGAQLYFMMVADTQTIAMICDKTNADGAIKLVRYGAGAIKVIGCITDDVAVNGVTEITITNGINADCYTAAANLKSMLNDFAAAQQPLRGLIGATSYNGIPGDLVDETDGTSNNRVGFVIGDTQVYDATYTSAAIGLALGTKASLPVQRKISRVANGQLSNINCFLATVPLITGNNDVAVISGRGFITFTTYAGKAGFYWEGDPMLTATTDDYKSLTNGCVIDKAQIVTYATYINEVDDEIPLNTDGSGTMVSTYIAFLQQLIIDAINSNMTVNKNISGVSCFIDPAQNVVEQGGVNIVLTITPVGYDTNIVVNLGFAA